MKPGFRLVRLARGGFPDRYCNRSDGVRTAIEHNQADLLEILRDGHVLTEQDTLLQRSVTFLSAVMEIERGITGPRHGWSPPAYPTTASRNSPLYRFPS